MFWLFSVGIFLPFGNMTTDDASLDNSYGCLFTASFGYSIVQPNVPIGGKIVDIFEVRNTLVLRRPFLHWISLIRLTTMMKYALDLPLELP